MHYLLERTTFVNYADTPEKTAEFARRAIAEMQRRHIAPNPNNYAVWYLYVAGQLPDLNKAIDAIDAAGETFSDAKNAQLHDRFLASNIVEAAIADAARKLDREMTGLIDGLQSAGEHANNYGLELGKAIDALANSNSTDDMHLAMASVLTTTKSMELKNRALEAELRVSAEEIRALRADMERLREEALHDSLTSIGNRRLFDQAFRQASIDAMEHGTPLSLVLIDIDHFKRFNDAYGHQVGDQALRLLGATLRDLTGDNIVAARYGGEEFAVVAGGVSMDEAVALADKIRLQFGGKVIRNRRTGEELGRITLSAGVALFRLGEPNGRLLERADKALFAAKNQGRDRVCSETDVTDAPANAD